MKKRYSCTSDGGLVGVARYNWGTNEDGPGSAPTLFIRGLADYQGVD